MMGDVRTVRGERGAPTQILVGFGLTFYPLSNRYCFRIEIAATYSKQTTATRSNRYSERYFCNNVSRSPAIVENVGSVMMHSQFSFSCPSRYATLSEGGKVSSYIKRLEGMSRTPSRLSASTELGS
jgi:hypothetical protein